MPAEGRDLLEWEQLGSQTSQFRCCDGSLEKSPGSSVLLSKERTRYKPASLAILATSLECFSFFLFFLIFLPHTPFFLNVYVVGTLSLYSCVKFSSSYWVSTNISVPFIFLSCVIALALELAVLDNFSDVSHPCLCTPQPRAFRHVPTRPWLLPEHWGLSISHHYIPIREPTELFPLPWTNVF